MTSTQLIIFQVSLSLAVAIITALLTVWLSLRRFYRERWWEAKMRAYSDVIHALHNMKRDLEISLPAAYEGSDTDTEFHRKWHEKHQAAWDEIRKQIDVGEFLFSVASVRVLQALIDDTPHDPNDSYVEHLEKLEGAVARCLPAIKSAGRKDLGLGRF